MPPPPRAEIPGPADVLVVGLGPAGAAAAVSLARAGWRVTAVDRSTGAPEKVCGDGLTADALRALEALGLSGPVLREARRLDRLEIHGPGGGRAVVRGNFASLPRARLDALLRAEARAAGAGVLAPCTPAAPLERDGRVTGALVAGAATRGAVLPLRARVTLLATGAAARPLRCFGILERAAPWAAGARLRLEVPGGAPGAGKAALAIRFDRALCPGYGWVFPGPGATVNLGVGVFYRRGRPPGRAGLAELWHRFAAGFAPAAAALRSGRVLAPLRAAPLRCGLSGSRPWRPGLLAVGEAAGLTLPLIGEGVGKALESGLLAADLVRAFLEGRLPESELGPAYASEIQARWGRLHHGYRRGQRWLASPRVCDFFVRRARRGGYVRRQIEGTLAETTHLGTLFTPLGLLRSMFS